MMKQETKQTKLTTGVICLINSSGLITVQTDTYLECLRRGNDRKRKQLIK